MNEPLPPELRAMKAGLDFIEEALCASHKVTILSPTAMQVHDDVMREQGRVEVAGNVLGWMIRHARTLTIEQMRELSVLIGLRKLQRDADQDYVRQDIEARAACHPRSE